MEPWNQKFCYSKDETFSNIFNGNIPSLVIKIDITQLFESPSQNSEISQELATASVTTISEKVKRSMYDEHWKNATTESKRQIFASSSKLDKCFQEVPVESLPTLSEKKKILIDNDDLKNALKKIKGRILRSKPQYTNYLQGPAQSHLGETQIPLEDLTNAVRKTHCQTEVNKTLETLPQNTELLQNFSIEPESTFSEDWLTPHKYLKNTVPELDLLEETETSHTGEKETLELPFQNTENFEEIHIESVAGKRKREILDEESEVSVRKMKCNLSEPSLENMKPIQEFPFVSESTLLKETQIHLEDFGNVERKEEFQISINETLETLSQNTELLRNISVEPESTLSENQLIPHKYLKNTVPEFALLAETETSDTGEKKTPELPFQNTENFEEIHIESVTGKRKRELLDEESEVSVKKIKCNLYEPPLGNTDQVKNIPFLSESTFLKEIHLKDFKNVEGRKEFQISVNEAPESLSQNSKYLQQIPVSPELSLLEKTETAHENFTDILKKTTFQIDVNEILELPFQNTQNLKEIFMGSTTGKNKTQTFPEEGTHEVKKTKRSDLPPKKSEPLQEVSSKSVLAISKKKKRQILDTDFKNILKKIKRQYRPELQISSSTVQIINDLISHGLDIFDKELHAMKKVRKFKTLTETELELAMKLSFPKVLSDRAMKHGRFAIQAICKNAE